MTGITIILWAMLCHNPKHIPGHTSCPLNHVIVTANDEGPGDSGNTPPKPPTPPPPPTGPGHG